MLGRFDTATEDFLDFARCQRPDGSYYGTSGQCRKGNQVGAKELNKLKEAAKKGNKKAQLAVEVVEGKKTKKEAIAELKGKKSATTKPKTAPAPKAKASKKPQLTPEEAKKQEIAKAAELREAFKKKPRNLALEDKLRKELAALRQLTKTPEDKENEAIMKAMKKRAAKKPVKTEVSKEAKQALLTYARDVPQPPAYKEMNGCARGKKCSKQAQQDIENLDKALKQWPANTSGASHFRGFNASGDFLAQFQNLKPGDSFTDSGFGSYSRSPEVGRNFSQGAGTRVIIESRSKALRGIEQNATYKSEQEAILPRNTQQTVREVRQVGEFLYVTVD